jgi:hypothetical protein
MVIFATIGAIAGALLGARFKVLVLIPATLIAVVAVIATCRSQHLPAIALAALATTVSLQIGYMAGCGFRFKVQGTGHIPSTSPKAHSRRHEAIAVINSGRVHSVAVSDRR